MLFYLSVVLLTAAVLGGGGTHPGFAADTFLQFLAIPMLCIALWPAFSPKNPHRKNAKLALYVCASAAFIPLLQLCPLPFNYTTVLRSLLPGQPDGSPALLEWNRLTITPEATWAAALSSLVPLAIFAAAVQLRHEERLKILYVLTSLGALSLLLGMLQVLQGPASGLRFYEVTNNSEAVGFFANRNHFAALLNVTLVLAALWLRIAAEETVRQGGLEGSGVVWLAAAAAFVVADVAGLTIARSRAGAIIAIMALSGIAWTLYRQTGGTGTSASQRGSSRISFAAALFALIFAAFAGLGGVLARFETDPLAGSRINLSTTTLSTALRTLPFGTGLGSFTRAYAAVENSADASSNFANRAHNDAAELFLETGIPGVALLAIFLIWYGRRCYHIWTDDKPHRPTSPSALEAAACLITGLFLLHSTVDYPLRTAALVSIFAFFCAILAAPARQEAGPHREKPRKAERLQPKSPEAWQGESAEWPESWKM
jgi:O-antigen ligase